MSGEASDVILAAERSAPHVRLARALAALLIVVCLLWNLDVPARFGFAFIEETFQSLVLGLALTVVYLTVTVARNPAKRVAWYDMLLAAASFGVLLYASVNFLRLKESGYSGSTNEVIILGAVITALVLEGLRRTAGHALLIIVCAFLVYAPLAHLVPGKLVGLELPLWQITMNLGFNPNAVFGLPLVVSTTVVTMFILMGQVLFKAGGGEFFTDLAMSTMGRRRGGAAKISVVASGLFGTISGTAVSNVVTTGIITMPLMQRSGYKPTHAGAIEAIASTGGQLMPPIMGAAAFLMAEFLEIPYSDIVIAALLPALLYYFAVFVQVDLVAARDKITFVEQDVPSVLKVLAGGWYFVAPFAVLIYMLFFANQSAEVSAIYAAGAMLVLGMVFSYGGRRIRFSDLYGIVADTGIIIVGLLMIVAASGLVIGVLNMTGLGLALPNTLVEIAGNTLWFVLVIAAVICIVLGMGMPTTAVYILLAALVAPAVIAAGVEDIPAHMFILYFGMMSMITPPIALAAFAATTITKADPMVTGFVAMRYGWVAYVVPFMFVYSPTLLMIGEPMQIAVDALTATFGVYLISAVFVGYMFGPLTWIGRAILFVAGTKALVPDSLLADTPLELYGFGDASGILLGIVFMAWHYFSCRKEKAVAQAS